MPRKDSTIVDQLANLHFVSALFLCYQYIHMEVQRDTSGDTPSSTIALLPKYMLSRDAAHSFSGFYSKTKISSAC